MAYAGMAPCPGPKWGDVPMADALCDNEATDAMSVSPQESANLMQAYPTVISPPTTVAGEAGLS